MRERKREREKREGERRLVHWWGVQEGGGLVT